MENKVRPAVNPDSAKSALVAAEDARSAGKHTIEWNGERYPLTSFEDELRDLFVTNEISTTLGLEARDEYVAIVGTAPDWDFRSCDLDKYGEPEGLLGNVKLKRHQKYGFAWLRWLLEHEVVENQHANRGALLADDMGLGKTLQVVSLIAHLRSTGADKTKPILVVAPQSLLRTSWETDGFVKFVEPKLLSRTDPNVAFSDVVRLSNFPDKFGRRRLILEALVSNMEMKTSDKSINEATISGELRDFLDVFSDWTKNKIILSSYESLRQNVILFGSIDFSLVILDEAQRVKNASSLQTHAAKSLKSEMYVAMSGTPIENSLLDLWSIMDFIKPGHLSSIKDFNRQFATPIKKSEIDGDERKELRKELEMALAPIWLRRTKADILTGSDALPKIHHYDSVSPNGINQHLVLMSDKQHLLYMQKATAYSEARGGQKLVYLEDMLQACHSPWKFLDVPAIYHNKDEVFNLCPKLSMTLAILKEIREGSQERGQKVLIFADVKHLQRMLASFIQDWHHAVYSENIEVDIYNGDLNSDDKLRVKERFENKTNFQVMILSPRAGGVGLNLTCANHVIHYTREWNPAVERQATDRVYRIGQSRETHVYYPTSALPRESGESAEQRLAKLLNKKRQMMDDFTVSTRETEFSFADFEDLNNQVVGSMTGHKKIA